MNYVFVIALVFILGLLIYSIIRSIQKTKRIRDEYIIKRDEINMESEIIKNLRELVQMDSNKAKQKDDPEKRYVYQKGSKQYILKSEQISIPPEKFVGKANIRIVLDLAKDKEDKNVDVREKLVELLKSENAKFKDIYDNYIKSFLEWKVKTHIIGDPNIPVYLINYSEKCESYVIEFTIVTIALLSQYGSIRSGIDYFIKDIKALFKKSSDNWKVDIDKTEESMDVKNYIEPSDEHSSEIAPENAGYIIVNNKDYELLGPSKTYVFKLFKKDWILLAFKPEKSKKISKVK